VTPFRAAGCETVPHELRRSQDVRDPASEDATRSRTRPVDRPDDTQHGDRFGDFTRPIAREKQLVKGRAKRGVIALAATVITAALVAPSSCCP